MTAHAYQDPIVSSAEPATLERWRTAQKRVRYDVTTYRNASASDLRSAGLPSSMRGMYRHGEHAISVPMYDMHGELLALLSLPHKYHPDGPNDFHRPGWTLSGRLLGLHYWHGPQIEGDGGGKAIGIVEHVHDAPTWVSETRTPCAVAFHPDNFTALAAALHAMYPRAAVVFWARRATQAATMQDAAHAAGIYAVHGSDGPDTVPALRKVHAAKEVQP